MAPPILTILAAAGTALLLVAPAASAAPDDFESVRRAYVDDVRPLVDQDVIAAAALDPALAVIDQVAASAQVAAFELLGKDGRKLAGRIANLETEREALRAGLPARLREVAEKTAKERDEAQRRLTQDEERLALLDELMPSLRRLRDGYARALVAVIGSVAEARPEEAWSALLTGFEADARGYFDLDEQVRDLAAELKSLQDRQASAAALKPEEQDALNVAEAEARARLEALRIERDQRAAEKTRRIEAIAAVFPRLPDGRRSKEFTAIERHLDAGAPFEERTLHLELFALVAPPGASQQVLVLMKRAAKARVELEKQLVTMRESYARALQALTQAAIGGGGMVPAPTKANEVERRRELQETSRRAYGESRVLEAGVGALAELIRRHAAAGGTDLETVRKALAKEREFEVRARVAEALGRVDLPEVREDLRRIARADSDLGLRLVALDALAARQDDALVELCVTTLLRDPEWRVRSAAMRALAMVPRKSAIPALIDALAAEQGRLVDDAEQALVALTGRSFHGDVHLWKDWWSKTKDSFEFPRAGVPPAGGGAAAGPPQLAAPPSDGPSVSFYGITTRSKRIVFVLDRSGSMNEPVGDKDGGGSLRKIDAARAQLKSALGALAAGDHFNIVTYAYDVETWQKGMTEMSGRVADKAARYVDKEIQAEGGTNVYDALREAFRIAGIGAIDRYYDSNVDTIFFLTDGMPTVGEVIEPDEILRRVREWNKLARVVVHAIGVGKDHDAAFLRRLAEENGGQYASR